MQKSRCAITRRAANTNQLTENRLTFNRPTCCSRLAYVTCTLVVLLLCVCFFCFFLLLCFPCFHCCSMCLLMCVCRILIKITYLLTYYKIGHYKNDQHFCVWSLTRTDSELGYCIIIAVNKSPVYTLVHRRHLISDNTCFSTNQQDPDSIASEATHSAHDIVHHLSSPANFSHP